MYSEQLECYAFMHRPLTEEEAAAEAVVGEAKADVAQVLRQKWKTGRQKAAALVGAGMDEVWRHAEAEKPGFTASRGWGKSSWGGGTGSSASARLRRFRWPA